MREIIPRSIVGTETAARTTSSANQVPVTSETAIAVLAIGIGGALYFMSRDKPGFQVGKAKETEVWLDRVERQAYRAAESKDLTPAQREAVEDVRMCAESAYGKFKPIGRLRW